MQKNYDVIFAKAAIHNKLIPVEKAKELLKSLPEGKSFAVVAIEKNLIPRETAEKLIRKINDISSAQHPAVPKSAGVHTRKRGPSQAIPAVPKGTRVRPRKNVSSKALPDVPKGTRVLPRKNVSSKALPDVPKGTRVRPRKNVSSGTLPDVPKGTRVRPRKNVSSGTLPDVPKGTRVRPRRNVSSGALPAVPEGTRTRFRNAPKEKSKKLFLLIGGAAIVLVGLVIGIAVALSGNDPSKPEKPVLADAPKEEPVKDPLPGPEEKPDPDPDPEPDPVPEVKKNPALEERNRFYQKLKEQTGEAKETLEEYWAELREKRAAAEAQAAQFRKRFEGRRMTIQLVSGRSYPDARLIDFSFDSLRVKTGSELDIGWSLIAPATTRKVARIVYPDQPFERGRFLTARKLWTDAKAAFEEALEKEDEYEDYEFQVKEIVPILDKLIAGEGAFQGSAVRMGKTGLELTYDFSDGKQADDFLGTDVRIADGKMVCTKGYVQLSNLNFTTELDARMNLVLPEAIYFMIRNVRLELGKELILRNMRDKSELVKGKGIPPGKERKLRVWVRNNKLEFHVDGKKVLSGELPVKEGDLTRLGPFRFEVKKGEATFSAPLVVRGELDPNDLRKRFAEVEVLIQRATAGDLEDIEMELEKAREERVLGTHSGERVNVSANGLFFVIAPSSSSGDLATHGVIKSELASFLQNRTEEGLVEKMDAFLKKFPGLPDIHYYRGLFHLEIGKRDEAKKGFDRALEIFPEFYECLTDRARLHLYDHQYDQGLVLVEKALKMRPDYASAYALRGMLSYAKNQVRNDAVRDDLDIASTLDPKDNEITSHKRAIETESKGPRYLGCIHEYESEHYRVVTDISEEAAREYARRLEAAFGWYREYLKKVYPGEPDRKPRVAVFNTREAYYTYNELIGAQRRENTLGIFRQWYNELVLFEDAEIDKSLTTLYHEAFHHFMSISSKHTMPYWFNEGMADYMGGMTIQGGKVRKKGRVLGDEFRVIRQALKRGFYLPFEKIMTQSPAQFYSGQVGFKYSQSWSMCHFFHHAEKGKYRPLLDRYFLLLHSGKHRQEAFDEVFGGKTKGLEREWKKYVLSLKLERKGS